MYGMKDSEEGADPGRKIEEVGLPLHARQNRRIVEVISAARTKLENEGRGFLIMPATQEQEPLDRKHAHKLRTSTVLMWILVIATALLALFVFTSPLHLGRYSGVRYWADIILGISYITLGVSVVAICVWIVARYSLLRK